MSVTSKTSPSAQDLLRQWVLRETPEQSGWLEAQYSALSHGSNERDLHLFLGLAPRRLGKRDMTLSPEDLALADLAYPGWHPAQWSLDGAARIAALLVFRGPRAFSAVLQDLLRTADAHELITLYRGLPLYPQASSLTFEVGEGLRSNMRAVFESIVHHNPYPRDHFDEHRWNHMVLKALFVGSRLNPIVGLDVRANPELARILLDYAEERWAAGRVVSPELWRCVGPFADEVAAYSALERALSGSPEERSAATLALMAADTPTARNVLLSASETMSQVANGRINWEKLTLDEAA